MSNLGMDQEENHSQKGVWFVLLAAILFGLSTPIAKGLLREISPQILAGLFYLSSGIGLMLVRWLLRKRTSLIEAPLSRRDVPWLSGAVVFGGVLAPLLLLSGLLQTPASNASLLLNLEGVLTVVLAQVALHENLNRRAGAGVTAILVGGALITWQPLSAGGAFLGPLAIALACLC
jgi:drug/metabolite transporter (DMT)-like permease